MKFIIADRHWMIRAGIIQLATECRVDLVAIEAEDIDQLNHVLHDHSNVVSILIDEALIADAEEEVFSQIRKLAPDAAIGVLMARGSREHVLKAIYFGATVVLLKTQSRAEFRDALALALDGKVSLPRAILTQEPTVVETDTAAAPPPIHETLLTRREREVMGLLGRGQSVSRIATALKLSPHTVRVHVTRIMKKLDLRDRSALMHYAVSHDATTLTMR